MTDKLDMSLDDIIKLGKKSRGGGGRGGRSRGSRGGVAMRRNTRNFRSNRSTPYSRPKQLPNKWQHDLFDGGIGASPRSGRTGGGLSTGTKLHISNLDFGVSESDIEELFREFGKMKRSCVHYDASGRSHGTAEVVYQRREDALNAIKQYNGVPLDGRAMKIEMVSEPAMNRQRETFRSQGSIGGSRGRSRGNRGRGRRGFGRGRSGGGSGNKRQSKTAEELDAELDAYHDQGILKGGQALKVAKHNGLVCVSFEKIRSLNNHNRLKASDAKKGAKVNLFTLLNYQIKDSEDSIYVMGDVDMLED